MLINKQTTYPGINIMLEDMKMIPSHRTQNTVDRTILMLSSIRQSCNSRADGNQRPRARLGGGGDESVLKVVGSLRKCG